MLISVNAGKNEFNTLQCVLEVKMCGREKMHVVDACMQYEPSVNSVNILFKAMIHFLSSFC